MDLGIGGRTAVVTGASRGIGAATARLLEAEGVRVIGVSRGTGIDVTEPDAPARFAAHPPADVLGRIKRDTADLADALITELSALAAPEEQASFFTLRDRAAVIDHASAFVSEARQRVAVCAWAADLDWLARPLRMRVFLVVHR